MYYPKCKDEELSNELFKQPTSEYRATPFWAWNCKLEPKELCRQIEVFKEMGFGGFYMHSRDGLDTAYLGDEFMEAVKRCADKAKDEKMLACLYDEDRYSSGFAGGLLTRNRRYSERQLLFTREKREGNRDRENAAETGDRYLEAVYDIIFNENKELESFKIIDENDTPLGEKWYAYSQIVPPRAWFNNETYVDTFSKEALDKFIEITHERYKDTVGDMFGSVIPTIFTDEILYSPIFLQTKSGSGDACLPWSIIMAEKFKKEFGSEIYDILPEAVWELSGGRKSANRILLHDFWQRLFNAAFLKNVGEWCRNNGIMLTGHMMREETLAGQTNGNGEVMPAYRYMDLPGMDMFANSYHYTCAKQVQSIVHQDGKEGMTSELYGVSNWNYDFRGHKNQGDWQAALGVTIRVPHLAPVSMKGSAKRDYPQFFSYQSPWYERYSYMENHFARLNTALTRGKAVVKVGVIHPIESCHMNYGPNDKTLDHIKGLDAVFKNVCEWLIEGQIDFDYISESLLPDMAGKVSGFLEVGQMKYSAVIVAGCETLRQTTLDILKEFHTNGGKVVCAGAVPQYLDGIKSSEPNEFFNETVRVQLDKYSLINVLENERLIKITESDMALSNDCVYQMRIDNSCLWLFIAPMKRLNLEHKNDVVAKQRTIKIKGKYTPIIYDTLSGETNMADFDVKDGYTYVYYTFYQSTSLLLRLNPFTRVSHRAVRKKEELIKKEFIFGKVSCKRTEPNVVLLDAGEYRINGGEYCAYENIRKIYEIVLKELGYSSSCAEAEPWTRGVWKKPHTVELRFEFYSEIELSGARLACENGEESIAALNGTVINMVADGYFTDKSIKTYPLPNIKEGRNVINVTIPFGEYSDLENYFILGEFNVRLEGTEKTITAPAFECGFGDVSSLGMPFYGGTLKYAMDITAPEDCDAYLTLSSFAAPCVAVILDNEDVGTIAFSPYKLELDNLKKGKHRLEFIAYGNRHNSFGALHMVTFEKVYINSGSWNFETDDRCNYKYEYELRRFGIIASPKIEYVRTSLNGAI